MERALGSRYRLGESLGSGAMGQVFVGVDTDGREFAFKILRSDLTGNPDAVNRFLQERSILTGLRHPNLVGVHDLVVEGDTVAIVMDLVRGGDLRHWLNGSGTLLPSEVARIGANVAWALAAVHAAQVVHRDVKPENILMDDSTPVRTPRLTDFGISSLARTSEVGRSSLLAGTPQYVAPELAEGEDATPASDLYSLGIVLYELCCGVTPFAGRSMLAVIRQHAEQEPGRPNGIPDPLWELISWLLRKSPRARPQSAQQVATLLDALVAELVMFPVAPRLDSPPVSAPIAHAATTQLGIPRTGTGPIMNIPYAAPPVRKNRRKAFVLTALAVLLLLGGATTWATTRPASGGSSGAAVPAGTSARQIEPVSPADAGLTTAPTSTTAAELVDAPNVIGKKLADAQDILASLEVTTVDSIQQGAEPGTVVAQDPKPGEHLNGKIKLTVARDAIQVDLAEVPIVSGQWSSRNDPGSIAGKQYLHSVAGEVGTCGGDGQVEYNIAKGFRRLVATGGIDDNAKDSEVVGQLEIFGDGRKLSSLTLVYGKPTAIDLDLSGVLRLTFKWQTVKTGKNKYYCDAGYVILGEATLLGLPGEVPTSAAPTS